MISFDNAHIAASYEKGYQLTVTVIGCIFTFCTIEILCLYEYVIFRGVNPS